MYTSLSLSIYILTYKYYLSPHRRGARAPRMAWTGVDPAPALGSILNNNDNKILYIQCNK